MKMSFSKYFTHLKNLIFRSRYVTFEGEYIPNISNSAFRNGQTYVYSLHGVDDTSLSKTDLKTFPANEASFLFWRKTNNLSKVKQQLLVNSFETCVYDFSIDNISKKRVSSKTPSKFIRHYLIKGFDIKAIWDLSRFQFLDSIVCEQNHRNLKNTLLSNVVAFMFNHKPYIGPNWMSTMEVAIRGVNVCYYYDLLRSDKSIHFSKEEQDLIESFIYTHFLYIKSNLEWAPTKRGNHYLSNICGLIFIGARLATSKAGAQIIEFALTEFRREIEGQFFDDGTYYENSTAYHRLSLELAFFTIQSLTCCDERIKRQLLKFLLTKAKTNLPKSDSIEELIQVEFLPLLNKARIFCESITLPNGAFHQVGDNDSGRFIVKDSHWLAEFKAQYGPSSLIRNSCFTICKEIEEFFCRSRYNFERLPTKSFKRCSPINFHNFILFDEHTFPIGRICSNRISVYYPDFGLFITRSEDFYLGFRCGLNQGKFSHAHEDQLSVELFKSSHLIADKGSRTYSRNLTIRNIYRNSSSHFVPNVASRQAKYGAGLFRFEYRGFFDLLYADDSMIVGSWEVDGMMIRRKIRIGGSSITISDYVSAQHLPEVRKFQFADFQTIPQSLEYGTP